MPVSLKSPLRRAFFVSYRIGHVPIMKILTGDIGGTKTRIALLESAGGGLKTLQEATYASRDHDSLTDILASFIAQQELRPQAAGFAIAGPVEGRTCNVTNLPWQIDADELERRFSL
ncbi:MAG: glucokinase, partial [Gammaproteobacteria bacterium]|nr:glucokinase [Gammaproteobacteria bacterium]